MNGHNLMTLLISYLVVAKINLSYERYMKSRHAIGVATCTVRELCQLVNMNSIDGNEERILWQRMVRRGGPLLFLSICVVAKRCAD
jgi:predicted membrane chloride channel (bestrophin family)